jgi:hypothetical protein
MTRNSPSFFIVVVFLALWVQTWLNYLVQFCKTSFGHLILGVQGLCSLWYDLNYLLRRIIMTLRVGNCHTSGNTGAYIGLALIVDCHPFSCLFNNCKCSTDGKRFNILYVCFLFSFLLNFFIVENVLRPKHLF